jgi:hypothetical protein
LIFYPSRIPDPEVKKKAPDSMFGQEVAGTHHFEADSDPALADTHPDLAVYFNAVRFRILIIVTTGL